MAKRANGEGSVNRYNNGWRATITLGRGIDGKLIRKQFYGKTKSEVLKKVDDFKVKNTLGLSTKYDKVTVQEWIKIHLSLFPSNCFKNNFCSSIVNILTSLLVCILGSGLRIGELLGLKWSDINFENNELKVSRSIKRVKCFDENSNTKTKIIEQLPKTKYSIRTIPLPEVIINELKRHKNIIFK